MYDVFAVKYAERDGVRAEHFLGADPHDLAPMPMDYFVWVVRDRGSGAVWVVDTGFESDDATARRRRLLRTAAEGVALVGVDPEAVTDVILTHFHYDHAGGVEQFPNATFHAQDAEMAFATGRDMTRRGMSHSFNVRHIQNLVGAVFAQRVRFHDGDVDLAPGLSLHHIGGHTRGLQVVRVANQRRTVVLASDATHYYEHVEQGRTFPTVVDVAAVLEGYDTLRRLAGVGGIIVPGHDPLVFERFPPAGEGLEGIAVRLG